MGKTWVLHTETKGTGAQVVPLESVEKRTSVVEPVFVPRKPAKPAEPPPPRPRAPRRFKIVDLMTRKELADGVLAQEALDVLRDARSIVDVNVYVWHEERDRWRPLTFAERRVMWDQAHAPAPA
ncbi:MAG TPA: hypothetical protein VFI54_24545 [Solirubrobacteraceae bacterium]|nr:hypothetical protein [Solirubrobacteraceae bacterium]